ncbi:MAG TPA: YraN family protein [Xanthomonadales bacterium]|nr:YraN family protein [Xanthomonadales bacterium]
MFERLRARLSAMRLSAAGRDVHVAPTEQTSGNPVVAGATRASRNSRTSKQQSGDHAETAALAHLRAAGLTLIARNFIARGGELDLVMREGNALVFVEVRFRADGGHGDGLDSVSPTKQRRLIAAARQYLADHPKYARWPTRFDVVALGAGGLRWVKNVIAVDEAGW